ncbi:MAG: sigma-70 family RNA polymerase sigma factor [Firmicutes bacterium]|nr:sigma-70 family RNA polymerase sigma factor [Bacillota bacterium]
MKKHDKPGNNDEIKDLEQPKTEIDKFVAELIEEYYPLVYRYCLSKTSHPHEADDITQEVFTVCYQNAERLRDRSKAKNWIMAITNNLINLYFRRFYNRLTFEPISEELLSDLRMAAAPADDFIEVDFELSDAYAVFERTAEDIRQVVAMQCFEGMSYEEMASKLDIPKSTVRGRIATTKKQFIANALEPDVPSTLRNRAAKAVAKVIDDLESVRQNLIDNFAENAGIVLMLDAFRHQDGSRTLFTHGSLDNIIFICEVNGRTRGVMKTKNTKATKVLANLIPKGKSVLLSVASPKDEIEILRRYGRVELRYPKPFRHYFLYPDWFVKPDQTVEVEELCYTEIQEFCEEHSIYGRWYSSLQNQYPNADFNVKIFVQRNSQKEPIASALLFKYDFAEIWEILLLDSLVHGEMTAEHFKLFVASVISKLVEQGYIFSNIAPQPNSAEERVLKVLGFRPRGETRRVVVELN